MNSAVMEQDFAAYRDYLLLVTQARLAPAERVRVDISAIVQQTLLEAHLARDQMRGQSNEARLAWLRRILSHNLTDAFRKLRAAKRDIGRQRSLEIDLEHSAAGLRDWLAADDPTASQTLHTEERAQRLALALARLPPPQCEALVLQHWHGWTLAQIAAHLNRTPAAVGGLLKRGLKQLRQTLAEDELLNSGGA